MVELPPHARPEHTTSDDEIVPRIDGPLAPQIRGAAAETVLADLIKLRRGRAG